MQHTGFPKTPETVFRALDELAGNIHYTAIEKGWYDSPTSFVEKLMLCVGELSEALQEYRLDSDFRKIKYGDEEIPKPEGVAVELADTLIRLLDLCAWLDIPIREAVEAKMLYNQTRPYRHGGRTV